jgi:hypothetical protein
MLSDDKSRVGLHKNPLFITDILFNDMSHPIRNQIDILNRKRMNFVNFDKLRDPGHTGIKTKMFLTDRQREQIYRGGEGIR